MNPARKKLVKEYIRRKAEIDRRLAEFRAMFNEGDKELFSELCFCIFTANANALLCNDAINDLKRKGLILKGDKADIVPSIKGRVRFHNNKADYLVSARRLLTRGRCVSIKDRLDKEDVIATRDWLVDNIRGFGYKEASHYLRNIGLGVDIAILDRHILKNLKRYGVIQKIPATVGSRKVYLDIEDRMRKFSEEINIPLEALDLLFWSMQTGFIFK